MWWLDPGKEVLNVIFNRILAPYVENLDMNQVNYGIGQGQLTLKKLRLKKGALDKFRLPVDVIEGHLGTFTLSLHWRNLGNQPVELLIEDVYLLVVPSSQGNEDPEENEARAQAAKRERLENAELLHMNRNTAVQSQEETPEQQGLLASLIAKIINNLQVTIKNIHVRYEDKLSVPGHPFAAGLTLAGFSAFSVDENWVPAFIESTAGSIHKLSKLESLAVYIDTDTSSMAGLPYSEAIEKFKAMIASEKHAKDHQYILKPVSGEGRIVMHKKLDNETPRFDVQLFFDEIGVLLDDNQYRDAISLVDMYHIYMRNRQYLKFRPTTEELEENRPRALLNFAGKAILDGVHERRRKWTWAYFAERRDDRHRYVELFKKKQLNTLRPQDTAMFEALEKKLSYEDIRFYRSIARSELRKDAALRRQLEDDKKKQDSQQSAGWGSWLWGSSSSDSSQGPDSGSGENAFTGPMTEEQRKELYDVLDYDEKAALAESFEAPRGALKMRVAAKLEKGSLALMTDPHGKAEEVISIVFDAFQADFVQRADNFELTTALGGLRVFDGTTKDTLYPQIVHVKSDESGEKKPDVEDPFFFVKFENNPLDERADSALTVRMRHMEIIYHRGYVEAIYRFFKPPASQLESVEALLNAASQTLEGLRKETRAGLEYALQNHKTVDIQMDMNAPVIIIPESITTNRCKHLLIDAGHISIESNLADKEAIRQIHLKRNQNYTDEDYVRLESLMYDKFSLKLHAAQFVLGDELQACRDALTSDDHNSLHLLERINIDLQVQNSIVPSAVNLSRFKVSGNLPTLQLNFSDTKYKSIMRLVDVTIPKLGDDDPSASATTSGYQIPSGLFPFAGEEYTIDDDHEDDESKEQSQDGGVEQRGMHQRTFELNFQVDTVRASISKSQGEDGEKPLGDLSFNQFTLTFGLEKFDMTVDISLGSLSMNLMEPGAEPLEVLSSVETDENKDLLTVKYHRVQKASPEFFTMHEGIDQNVDIKISTVVFRAAPEPVLTLYDFIMSTFVAAPSGAVITETEQQDTSKVVDSAAQQEANAQGGKIRVLVELASVEILLVNAAARLATLSLSTAKTTVLLFSNTMNIHAKLGSLSLTDDSDEKTAVPEFKQIMSIEGDNLAEFRYETFDPNDHENYKGIKSSVYLAAASVKLHYLEQPLHDIYLFMNKLAKLKGLYDAATQVAVQRASEIERMKFEISVKTPILVFPSDVTSSQDALTLRLGEITANNAYEDDKLKTSASLRGIQLISTLYHDSKPSTLKIIDDIEVEADVVQAAAARPAGNNDYPDTQVNVKVSDIKLYLTQVQYGMVIALSQSIPKILSGAPEGAAQVEDTVSSKASSKHSPESDQDSGVALRPELAPVSTAEGANIWTSLDLIVSINAVKLHLYDAQATTTANLQEHGVARFALNNNSLRLKMLSDGSLEAQVVLKSFTMSNTRAGNSKFREIIPAAQHDRNQFMILYTASGGPNPSSLAVLTVDSPKVIFAIDPVFALMEFFLSAFPPSPPAQEMESVFDAPQAQEVAQPSDPGQKSGLDFRFDLHDVSVSVLESETDANSQAIRLSIGQVLLSQQGIMALNVTRLGMSLTRMGKGADDVRFLDEVDMTVTLDSRNSSAHQMTSIDITSKPIVFRASYRDIQLIMTITNKALTAYNQSSQRASTAQEQANTKVRPSVRAASSSGQAVSRKSIARRSGQVPTVGRARVITSKEQLKASLDGFRLVLIGDLHEQPTLHLKVKPFTVGVNDWSGELQASTTLATSISYWNLTNSHWEPLIDPWTFSASVAKDRPDSAMVATLSSQERLNLNVSTTFLEMAVDILNTWSREGERVLEKARGSYAPYQIRNYTGTPLYIWADADGSSEKKDLGAVKVNDGQTIDWRFDDWKTMREHTGSAGQSSIGVQFDGQPWERLRSIPVDREGEFTYALRPRTDKLHNRMLCEVTVVASVKIVTLRSTYKVHNQTLYPVELTLVDDTGRAQRGVEKIAPGQDFSLPIDAVGKYKVRVQPDQGFGYKWSSAIRWEDLVSRQTFTLRCPHTDEQEAAFRFHAFVQTDATGASMRKYPKIDLKLRAPIELENLLPYNLQYRIYDKDTDQNWKSYLRTGGIMPVHSVELGHLVLLNVEIQDTVFKPSDFGIINTDGHSDFDIEHRLTLQDPQGRKLDLRLNYIRFPEAGGAFKVQIYSPYLIVNKMGIPFGVMAVRSARPGAPHAVAGDSRDETLSKPVPFLLSHPVERGNEFVLKVGNSAWSKPLNLEAPSAETELTVASNSQKNEEVHVGLSWTVGLGKYKLTKVITIAPRFLIKNNMAEPICFREHGVAPRGKSTLEPSERVPIHTMRAGYEKLLTIAFPGLNTEWSPPFSVEDIGSVHFRLKEPGERSTSHLIRADIKMDYSTIFVTINLADDDWPFTVENDSSYDLSFCQMDLAHGDADASSKANPSYFLPDHTLTPYAWDFPAGAEKKILLTIGNARRAVDIMEIGDLVPFKFHNQTHKGVVSIDVRVEGHKQVLRISDYRPENSLYRQRTRGSMSSSRVNTISSTEGFEAITEEIKPNFSFNVDFSGIGLSLINRRIVEVVYLSIEKLKFEYSTSNVAQSVNVSFGSIQLDNQLHDAIFPVVLQPTPLTKEARNAQALPTIQGSVIWLNDQEHGVLFVKYCSVLLQALTITADEDFLYTVYELSQIKGASWEEGHQDVLIEHPEEIPEPHTAASSEQVYFEVLELQPIRLALSFMRTERMSGAEKMSIRNPLAIIVNAITMAIGNVNDAPLEFNALAIKDMRLSVPDVQSRIIYHYRQEVLRQLYRILGSADFIGNPVGLFTNVSSGVADIFYEPFNGVVMHGNRELGVGIAKGAASFVKKTVFGFSDSFTKVTGSIGKGISAATLDSEYQKRRRITQRRNKPRHAIYGVTAGAEAFANSVASGAEGLVMKPIEGAESEGAVGFFKGVGKGLVGAVTKPVVGVFDLASNVAEGVRNTTTVFDNPARDRVRIPRVTPSDGVLVPYSSREALGQYWLKDLDSGAYRQESYVAHINIPGTDNVVMLTATRVLSFYTRRLRLNWELPFTLVQGVTIEDSGIRFSHKSGKDQDKFVKITDKNSQSWFFGQIATVVKAFNARRRMDS
ncbi:uncharacterized protein STEHIDRAFT_170692 [Stereum hirsutum FP-91666 SS1]|uniref:uncharacterized protein n=1 Tax=Stereum hirsutum (strain FP-91666) TaxID=721885 RepID=UPI0004449C67|nr:uncharacterized protein STEHIDRAFT_170692 [Stereum hirsutum FP-91666 SS1]EIM83408.1 hypothetical protein STEHIDRAFT_170692 [Stereum hirsutum FP-91666 SS1]